MSLTGEQVAQLLRPIAPQRVLADGKGHSHVSQQDVTAHLTRIFGFGGWDTDILTLDLVFERPALDRKTGKERPDRYDVAYRATMRLTVRGPDGETLCHYEDGSIGVAQNQALGDGHDLAMKSAISVAKKRCAISLGDQFGLSLYNRGQLAALVRGTLVQPVVDPGSEDVQDGVSEQVTLGNTEDEWRADERAPAEPVDVETLEILRTYYVAAIEDAATADQLAAVAGEIAADTTDSLPKGELRILYAKRLKELGA